MKRGLVFLILCVMVALAGCIPRGIYCESYEGEFTGKDCPVPTPEEILEEPQHQAFDEQTPLEELVMDQIKQEQTFPVVAIHVSDLSRKNWNLNRVNYFEQYTALEEILNQHKIPFVEVSDEDIENGELLLDAGRIKFPIVFTMNNEVWSAEGLANIDKYAKQGGIVFFTYSTFTRPSWTDRQKTEYCFILRELPLKCKKTDLRENIVQSDTVQRIGAHEIVSHIPSREVVWRMSRYFTTRYDNFLTETIPGSDLQVLTVAKKDGEETIHTALMPYGNGAFIYNSEINMLWGRYQGEPAIYNALTALNSIRWAFSRTNTPLIELKPWGEYQAAFMLRFDVETTEEDFFGLLPKFVETLERKGETGAFYILVNQEAKGKPDQRLNYYEAGDEKPANLIREIESKGMTIGSHSTWHIGPDFDGDEAEYNIKNSLNLLQGVLGHPIVHWVAPAFTANLDSSLSLVEELGIKTTGDQRIGYLPHFSLSPAKEGRHYSTLQIPTADIYHSDFGNLLATVLDHHGTRSVDELVDFYYDRQGLINLYSHIKPENIQKLERLIANVQSKRNIWHTTPDELVEYWSARDAIRYEYVLHAGNSIEIVLSNEGKSAADAVVRVTMPKGYELDRIRSEGGILSGIDRQNGILDISVSIEPELPTALIIDLKQKT